jgi:hypothetical protein
MKQIYNYIKNKIFSNKKQKHITEIRFILTDELLQPEISLNITTLDNTSSQQLSSILYSLSSGAAQNLLIDSISKLSFNNPLFIQNVFNNLNNLKKIDSHKSNNPVIKPSSVFKIS